MTHRKTTTAGSQETQTCERGITMDENEKSVILDKKYTCPVCDKDIKFVNPSAVPQKKGYRIIAFDQATERFGLSVFEDGQLIFYSLYTFSGDVVHRLTKIKKFVQDVVIKE